MPLTKNFATYERKYGLPAGLLNAVMMQESGGNVKAVSPAGAQGPFQFMPATAKDLGVDPLDMDSSADGAARYLKQHLDKYKRLDLALAAYNAGPGNIDKHKGIPPFKETEEYVPSVLKRMGMEDMDTIYEFPPDQATKDSAKNKVAGKATKAQILAKIEKLKAAKTAGGGKDGAAPKATKAQILAKIEALKAKKTATEATAAADGVEGEPKKGAGHNLGVAARAALHGVSGAASLPGNLVVSGINAVLGTKIKTPSQGFDEYISKFGVAQPENASERLASDVITGVTNPLNVLGGGMGVVSGGTGSLAAGATREAGGGPAAQFAAGMVGSLGAYKGQQALKRAPVQSFIKDTSSGGTLGKVANKPVKDVGALKVVSKLNKDGVLPSSLAPGSSVLEQGGKSTRSIGEAVSQVPGGREVAEGFFEKALPKSIPKIKTSIKDYISKNDDFHGTLEKINETGRATAGPMYQEAFKANQVVDSPVIDRILDTPFGRFALRKAAERMQNSRELVSKSDPDLTEIVNELSNIGLMDNPGTGAGIARGLKLKTLDFVKREMDAVVYQSSNDFKAADDIRQWSGRTKEIGELRSDFVKALDEADVTGKAGPNSRKPEGGLYKRAREVSGDYIRNSNAMNNGRDVITRNMDRELVAKTFNKLTPIEKESFKAGIAQELNKKIDQIDISELNNRTGNPIKNKIFNGQTKYRLSGILSSKEMADLSEAVGAQSKLFDLKNQMLGGSQTVRRAEAIKELTGAAPEIIDAIARRGWTQAAFEGTIRLIKNKFSGVSPKNAEDIATILYEADPVKQVKVIERLQKAAASGPAPQAKEALKAFVYLQAAAQALSKSSNGAQNQIGAQ